jgi:hypothetical protein
MGVMLDGSQRDAVYQFVLFDLSGIGDMMTLVRGGNLDRAQGLRQRFEQDMRLLDQIGWEPKGRKVAYAITLASDELRAIFRRLLGRAIQIINEPRKASVQVLTQASSVAVTSSIVLNKLPGGTIEPRR